MSDPAKPARRSSPASRRAFLKTLAAGSAAALTAPAFALAADGKESETKKKDVKPEAKAAPARPADLEKAIAEQKEYTKKTVATLRAYALETNAEQAFVFAPMKPGKTGGGR